MDPSDTFNTNPPSYTPAKSDPAKGDPAQGDPEFSEPTPSFEEAFPNAERPTIDRLQYLRCWTILGERESWVSQVAIISLVQLIPYVGQMVVWGYGIDCSEAIHRGARSTFCRFDFNRFGEYLMRGVWPWLTMFIATLLLMPVMIVLMLPVMGIFFAMMANTGPNQPPPIGAFVVFYAGIIAVNILYYGLLFLVCLPFCLRAGYSGEFKEAFNFGWAFDFLKRVWFEACLGITFFMVSATILTLLGYLACVIGAFAVMGAASIGLMFLMHQLYGIYLVRGGEPVPMKTPTYESIVAWQEPESPPK